jgi:hypothetical protein
VRLFLILLFALPLAIYSDEKIECPTSIKVSKTSSAPTEWKFFSGSQTQILERVGFYSGNPEEGASLVPDSSKSKKKESTDEWRFQPKTKHPNWIACYYTGIDSYLAKELNASTTKCKVKYKTTKAGARLSIANIRCE